MSLFINCTYFYGVYLFIMVVCTVLLKLRKKNEILDVSSLNALQYSINSALRDTHTVLNFLAWRIFSHVKLYRCTRFIHIKHRFTYKISWLPNNYKEEVWGCFRVSKIVCLKSYVIMEKFMMITGDVQYNSTSHLSCHVHVFITNQLSALARFSGSHSRPAISTYNIPAFTHTSPNLSRFKHRWFGPILNDSKGCSMTVDKVSIRYMPYLIL